MSKDIYIVREQTFTTDSKNRTDLTSNIIVAAYTNYEAAKERMERVADRFEKEHYMSTYERTIELPDIIILSNERGWGAKFFVNKTLLYEGE